MALPLQRYQSLTAQVTTRLEGEIAAGTWVDWLPGERALTDALHVSRKTIRHALAQLKRDGRITTVSGQGHRIVAGPRAVRRPSDSVGLLTLNSLEDLRPFTALWIDELRSLLFANRTRLATFSGHRFFTGRADTELARLVRQNPQACWVLAHTDARIQQWFCEQRVPCIVAGSSPRGVPLPNVDLDYFAVCRHAVGAMTRHGHRRLAFLLRESERAGDIASDAGFVDGARSSGHRDVEAVVMRHGGTVDAVLRALARLFDRAIPPTALLVGDPTHYLTTISFLAQRGLQVGREVSLISRASDSFLGYLTPAPAHYACSPRTYAKRLLPAVLTLAQGGEVATGARRIVPPFIPGPSLARPRGAI